MEITKTYKGVKMQVKKVVLCFSKNEKKELKITRIANEIKK